MSKAIAMMGVIVLGGHGLLGLLVEGVPFLGLFNVDFALDLVHLASAGLLLIGLAPTGIQPLDPLLTFGLGGAALIGAFLPHAERNVWETDRNPLPER